jgi:hypothetical protein
MVEIVDQLDVSALEPFLLNPHRFSFAIGLNLSDFNKLGRSLLTSNQQDE